jgi:hypothetical protein
VLDADDNKLAPEAVRQLRRLSELQELSIKGCCVGNEGARDISRCAKLYILEASTLLIDSDSNQICREGLRELFQLPNIHRLDVGFLYLLTQLGFP